MNRCCFTVIPAARVSDRVDPELRVFSGEAELLRLEVLQEGAVTRSFAIALVPGQCICARRSLSGVVGDLTLRFSFMKGETALYTEDYPYQVIRTGSAYTSLIDGCWISAHHWSEREGKYFNPALMRMTDADFSRHVREMAALGITCAITQGMFHSTHYAGKHSLTPETYDGLACYPSGLYPGRLGLAASDPVEAMLSAADECGMHFFLGLGNFAWFDFSEPSLRWHEAVARELFERYGGHPSFYGWYISEEMFGDLYYSYEPVADESWREIGPFFRRLRQELNRLAPTKPVALAPNNIRFHHCEREWKTILPYVDILIPFAFARDPDSLNLVQMKRFCEDCGTHMWVDMELFRMPPDDGLIPKDGGEVLRELEVYRDIEQNYGYQYTGHMNHPDSPFNLGGEPAKALYRAYKAYASAVLQGISGK